MKHYYMSVSPHDPPRLVIDGGDGQERQQAGLMWAGERSLAPHAVVPEGVSKSWVLRQLKLKVREHADAEIARIQETMRKVERLQLEPYHRQPAHRRCLSDKELQALTLIKSLGLATPDQLQWLSYQLTFKADLLNRLQLFKTIRS